MKRIFLVFVFSFILQGVYSQIIVQVQVTTFDKESIPLKNKAFNVKINKIIQSSLIKVSPGTPVKLKIELGKPNVLAVTLDYSKQDDSRFIWSSKSYQVKYSVPVKLDIVTSTDSLIYTYTAQSPVEYYNVLVSSGNEETTVGDTNVPRPKEQKEDLIKWASDNFLDYKDYSNRFMNELRDKTDVFLSGFLKQFKQNLASRERVN